MKKAATIFLQVVIVLVGIAVFALMLWEPHREGRNAHATLTQIYFHDPFLAYAYVASIAFFLAMYQGFRLLGYVRARDVFTPHAVSALRTIKFCAIALIVAIVGAEVIFIAPERGKDDIAGGVMMGLILTMISIIVATTAAVLERTLQSAVDLKSENDLTV